MAGVSDLAMRILIGAEDRTGPAFKNAKDGIQSIGDQLSRVETLAKRFLDIRLFTSLIQDSAKMVDSYNQIQGKIRQVVGETGNLAGTQDRLFKIAQSTAAPLKETVQLYARSAEALRKVSDGQELAEKLAETVNLSFKAQSTGTVEMASTFTQLVQAIGTATVTWEDFGNVSQANLLLTNVAAKNLGYDGIGGLKQAISESKVTGEQLTRAIVAGFDEIKARADQMPIGVERSVIVLNNALIKFSGESNAANTASKALSGTLQFMANNINTLANVALVLAEVYAVKLFAGLAASTKAMYESTIAARAKAAADREAAAAATATLAQEIRRAEVETRHSLNLIKEAQLQRALATTEQQRARAFAQLDAAYKAHAANVALLQAKNSEMNAVIGATGSKSTLAARGISLLGAAVRGLVALPLVTTLADWALKLDFFYASSMRVQEGMVFVLEGIKALADAMSMSDRIAQIRATHQEFNQLIANHGTAAKQSATDVTQAESEKARVTEEAAQKQAAAFKQVEEATKALTAQIDADGKAQTASIQQALAEKLIAIEAGNQLDSQKNSAKLQAQLEAAQQELTLQQNIATAKQQLIDAEYAGELQKAQSNAERIKAIETDKRQAKLSVYQGLAEFYAQEVNKLGEVYGQETQQFVQAKQSIEQAAESHEQRLLQIDRLGMTDRQKIQSEGTEYRKTIQQLKAEIAKGEEANQEKINGLFSRARDLQGEITQAAISSAETQSQKSSVVYDAKKRENEIREIEKQLLDGNAAAAEKSQASAKRAFDDAKENYAAILTLAGELAQQLNKEYALKIGIDSNSLSEAQRAIADLVKPETKTITIKTVNENGGSAPTAQATGGLAGQPTGEPWRFATGGFARMAGLLAGYGGGDRRKALLEDGEYVVRKEAVKELGVSTLDAVNQGQLPVQRASGGLIGKLKGKLSETLKQNALTDIKAVAKYQLQFVEAFKAEFGDVQTNNFVNGLYQRINKSAATAGIESLLPQMRDIVDLASKSSRDQLDTILNTGFAELAGELNTGSSQRLSGIASSKINMPSIPSLMPASSASSAPPAKVLTVEFKAPGGGEPVTATFNSQSDVNRMLDVLKQSGAVVGA